MTSPQRRFVLQQPVVADVGCGCRRSIFSTLFSASSSYSSSLKHRISRSLSFSSLSSPSSPTSSLTATISSFSSSPPPPPPAKQATSGLKGEKQSPTVKRRKKEKRNGVVEESVAVLKDSVNPYHDFYESMLVMIMEKEMYDWEDLCDLLHRYLTLNSSCHHHIILRAFADIWNNVFLPAAEVAGESTATTGAEPIPCNLTADGKMNSNYMIT